ncbi:MAG: GGDEF domain-containing protein [Rhodoferax sp.]|uniref:GGDEF domain-containing protein n=1 Tax=Rhodoferax sp. TaxID=50421 RepID=UPI002733610C|nr:GGDEF domain-containing protein [Rhodoferax sp.]MDP2678938.1 GGDEF domain-containing protein [Rhodoferax sp.]
MHLVQNTSYSPCVDAPHLFAPGEPQLARPVDLQVVCASVLGQIIAQRRLFPVFQPIAKLADGLVYAHEALIRGPEGGNLYAPDALFTQASEEALTFELELACLVVILQRWGELAQHGRLFINISAQALVRLISQVGMQPVIRLMRRWGISCRQLVLEITEHERVLDMQALVDAVKAVRRLGIQIALDDFGDGRSSLRLWSEVRPEVVKIDKYFTKHISTHADKVKTIQALQKIAEIFGSELVAEGIETDDDLRLLRDLGLTYGQGFFLARPRAEPCTAVQPGAVAVMVSRRVAVYPEARQSTQANIFDRLNIMQAPTIGADTQNDQVAALFLMHPHLHALPLVEGDHPIGIINRTSFLERYSKLYSRELWGNKPCLQWANLQPRLIESKHTIDDLLGILTSDDQRYLDDGFIVVDNGRYHGLCRGDQIVKSVTETRIEAARHANPLTFLPGNIPITQHIERMLARNTEFVVGYLDLNNFKSFNDRYGYWRGDEVIRLVAQVAASHVQERRDFLGHVGGDDFIVVFQSTSWAEQCRCMIDEFNTRAANLFDEADQLKGGIEAQDRQGFTHFFALTTLSIGAVQVRPGDFSNAEQVANAAAAAKHAAKSSACGMAVRRHNAEKLA